jgi:hypothetical protein
MVVLVTIVGAGVFFWLSVDPDFLGIPTALLIDYGLNLSSWLILYGWVNSQQQEAIRANEEVRSADKATLIAQQEPALETEIPIEPEVQPDSGTTRVATSASQIEAGQILLQYDDRVKLAFDSLDGLPQKVKDQFLTKVANDPQSNILDLRNNVILHSLGRPDLQWDQEVEDLIEDCKGADPDAVQELFRVFPVLSKRMSFADVFNKVIGTTHKEFQVIKAGGRAITVIQQGNGKFVVSFSFGRRTFSSDEEVYEFLGTPEHKRNSLPSS